MISICGENTVYIPKCNSADDCIASLDILGEHTFTDKIENIDMLTNGTPLMAGLSFRCPQHYFDNIIITKNGEDITIEYMSLGEPITAYQNGKWTDEKYKTIDVFPAQNYMGLGIFRVINFLRANEV